MGGSVSSHQRQLHLGLLVVTAIVMLILRAYARDMVSWLAHVPEINDCGHDVACYRHQLVYRAGLGIAVVYLGLLLSCTCGAKGANWANSNGFGFKLLFLPSFFFLSLLFPNDFCTVVAQAFGVCAFGFLVLQMLLLIDFGYSWNEAWVANAQEEERREVMATGKRWYVAILVSAGVLLLLAWTSLALMYSAFETTRDQWIISVTLVVPLLLLVLSITEWCEHGSLLTSSVVCAYVAWLAWSALASGAKADGGSDGPWIRLFGGLWGLATLVIACWSDQMEVDAFHIQGGAGQSGGRSNAAAGLMNVADTQQRPPVEDGGESGTVAGPAGAQQTTAGAASVPQEDLAGLMQGFALFFGAACYLTVLFSDWSDADGAAKGAQAEAYWVQISAQWCLLVLYAWTLCAPKLFPDRQF